MTTELLVAAFSYDQARVAARRRGLSPDRWRYVRSWQDVRGHPGVRLLLLPDWDHRWSAAEREHLRWARAVLRLVAEPPLPEEYDP